MFSSRFILIKMALAAGLLAALTNQAVQDFRAANPPVGACLLRPKDHAGATVFVEPSRVVRHEADGFVIDQRGREVRVRDASRPIVGNYVTIRGRFGADSVIDAEAILEHAGYPWKRGLMYGVSAAVLLAFLVPFFRAFRSRLSEGLLRG